MSQQVINIGTVPNDNTGDPFRTVCIKVNENFEEVYFLISQESAERAAFDDTLQALITQETVDRQNADDDLQAQIDDLVLDLTTESNARVAGDAATLASAQAYADALVVGLWDDRGNYNASGNTFPAAGGSGAAGAIKKGDIWTISVGGTLGGSEVEAGDTVRALIDAPGQTIGNWAIAQNNIGYAPLNPAQNLADLDDPVEALANLGVTLPPVVVSFDNSGQFLDESEVNVVYTRCPATGYLSEWMVLCDQLGDVEFDVWRDTYANYPPIVGDSIVGDNPPAVVGSNKGRSTDLSTWNRQVTVGDIIAVKMVSVTSLKYVNLFLTITPGP